MDGPFILELSILFGPARAGRREDSAALPVDVRLGYIETPKHTVIDRQVFEDVADVTVRSINVPARSSWRLKMKGDKNGKSARKNE